MKGENKMIRQLENGSGVSFSVMVDGKIVNFNLAVLAKKDFRYSRHVAENTDCNQSY